MTFIQFQHRYFRAKRITAVEYNGRVVTIFTRGAPRVSEFKFSLAQDAAAEAAAFIGRLYNSVPTENQQQERHREIMSKLSELAGA